MVEALYGSTSGIVDLSGVTSVTYAASAPVVEYTVPVPAVYAATAPVDEPCALRWYLRYSHVTVAELRRLLGCRNESFHRGCRPRSVMAFSFGTKFANF